MRKKYLSLFRQAEMRKTKMPLFMAIVISEADELRSYDAVEICNMFDMPTSYEHLVRSWLKVPDELYVLGKQVTNR
jgi:hypothetical protein